MNWEKKDGYYKSGIFRISKIDKVSYSLITVEPIPLGKGKAFLAYLGRSVKDCKEEAELYKDRV